MAHGHDPLDFDELERLSAEERQRSEQLAAELGELVRWMMNGKRGRRILWLLMSRCHVFGPTYAPNALDMAKMAGWRDCGLWILSLIHTHSVDNYAQMVSESNEDDRAAADPKRSR